MTAGLPSYDLIPTGGHAPEDVVVDRAGHLIVGVDDGRVLRINPETGTRETLVQTGGRPLGLEACADGRLLICDSPSGLLEWNPVTQTLTTLINEYQGQALPFCSNVVAAKDGVIYFSSSTDRYTIHDWKTDLIEQIPTGRLFRRDADGRVTLLLDGLYFANGLVLAPDEAWIIVAESGAYQLRRLWLTGPQAGTSEIFAEVPAFPDNCSQSADGLIWVALAAPRMPIMMALKQIPLTLRRIIARLPDQVQPKPQRVAWVQAYAADGHLVHDFKWTDGRYSMVTGVCQHGDSVYLSSLAERSIFRFRLPR